MLAAADGRVVYAGSGLRGYGNLVILKHNNTYLTAYAHNQTLLVKEDQAVRRGQKIAEMGASDADRVQAALRDPPAGQAGRPGAAAAAAVMRMRDRTATSPHVRDVRGLSGCSERAPCRRPADVGSSDAAARR